jgi:hypothetical protein
VLTLVELVGLLAVLTVRLTTFSRSRRAARHLSLLNTLLGFALQTANVFLSAEPAAAAEAPDLRADEPLVLNAVLAWDPLTDLLVGPLPHSFEAGAAVLDGTGPRHHQHPSSLSVVDLWRAIPSASAIHLSRTTRRSPAAGS